MRILNSKSVLETTSCAFRISFSSCLSAFRICWNLIVLIIDHFWFGTIILRFKNVDKMSNNTRIWQLFYVLKTLTKCEITIEFVNKNTFHAQKNWYFLSTSASNVDAARSRPFRFPRNGFRAAAGCPSGGVRFDHSYLKNPASSHEWTWM